MPTSLVIPHSTEVGWFDSYSAPKVNRYTGAWDEFVCAPADYALTEWETKVLSIWMTFHQVEITNHLPTPTDYSDDFAQLKTDVGDTLAYVKELWQTIRVLCGLPRDD